MGHTCGAIARSFTCFALWLAVTGHAVLPPEASASETEPPPPEPVPNQLLVRFRPEVPTPTRDRLLRSAAPRLQGVQHFAPPGARSRFGAASDSVFSQLALVETADPTEAQRAATELRARAEVLYVEPNFRLRVFADPPAPASPNDFEFGSQWGLRNTGQKEGQPGNDIRALDAWELVTDARAVRVAVIDTGVDYFHPDLEANVWTNPGEIAGNGLDDDGNGYVDDVHGYDFVSGDSDPMDDHSHGTHVAGIIGAVGNNRIGVGGVCWSATLMAIKAFDDHGEGTVAGVVAALRYAVDNGARVINASWGQSDKSRALQEAVTETWNAGVLIVAAAGNERSDVAPFPAAFDRVVAVAALNAKGERAFFSNFGSFVDLAAPGEAILSTTPNARYDLLSGTSMAAPHVTGVAALVLARQPELTNDELATLLRNAVTDLAADQYIGTGRLDAGQAVRLEGPLPTAKLNLPKVIAGRLDLNGTAAGPRFAAYHLEYGTGTYPTNWTLFHTSTQPVAGGPLYRDFSSARLEEGTFSIRLVVTDTLGQTAQDRAVAVVRNVQLTEPANNDSIRHGDRVTLKGTVFGAGRTYTIEHGVGVEPGDWSNAGIELADGGQREVFGGTLGWWDTGAATPNAFHTLRLRAFTGAALVGEWRARLVYVDGRLRPGWPLHLPATGVHPTNDWRHVTVADLDGDGFQEILRVQPGSPPGSPAQLLAFAPDGSVRWSHDLAPGDPVSDIPVVGDVDGDGTLEVFVDAGEDRRLYGFRHDGTPLGGAWPVPLPASAPGKVLADLDRDGRLELIGLAHGNDQPPLLFVLDADGHLRASWPVEYCAASAASARRVPAVGNFDRDRDLEILAPIGCSKLGLFDLDQPDGPLWVREVPGQILASPVVGDLDADGQDDILVGTHDPDAIGGRVVSGGLYALHGDGEPMPGWPALVDHSFATPPALGDLDGDGDLEIAVVDTGGREVYVLHHDGFSALGWPVSVAPIPSLSSAPVLADVDGNGQLDVVVAVPGLMLPVLLSGDYQTIGGVRAWRPDGHPIPLQPRGELPGLFFESGGNTARFKAPQVIVTDLDGNGRLDLVAASVDDVAYSPDPPVSTRKNRYSLYAWELPQPFRTDPGSWPMFQHDPQHTGYRVSPSATNHPPVLTAPPNQTMRLGGAFFAIDLTRYVVDADHPTSELAWTIAGTSHLEARFDPNGLLTVQPRDPQWTGSETLRLLVADPEGAHAEALVEYAVRADYVPPEARDDVVATDEDSAVTFDVRANDTHPLGLPLQVESVSRPFHGTVSLQPDGRLQYVPEPDFNGPDSFSYAVVDGRGGLALANVQLDVAPVPDDPVARPDRVSTDEDVPVLIDVLANDLDPDGGQLTLLSFTATTNGVVSLTPSGTLEYRPAANWWGADGFTYRVADAGGGVATGEVQVVVRPVNDPPVAEDQEYVINRNTFADVIYRASDPDGTQLSFEILDGPAHGELWKYPDIATYYPYKGFAGDDRFTYSASDGSGTSRVATVSFRVLDANNPPKTSPLELATRPGRPLKITLTATDADDDPVRFEIVTAPAHGRLEPAGTNFLYTPAPGYLGPDSLLYRATDGQDASPPTLVNLTVTDRNTAPVAHDATIEVRANTPTSLTLDATDGEGDPLQFTLLTAPAAGELTGIPPTLLYTPVADYVGPDRFTFQARDDAFDSTPATVTLFVAPRNRMPAATNQTIRIPANQPTLLVFDLRDPDDDPLRVAILKGPQQGRLFGLGTNFIYAPKPGAGGYDRFTYKAWDGHIYSEVRVVTLELESSPPWAPPRFERIEGLDATRGVRLTLRAEPGRTLEIQRSTDLADWTTVATFTATAEVTEWTDSELPRDSAAWYRAASH